MKKTFKPIYFQRAINRNFLIFYFSIYILFIATAIVSSILIKTIIYSVIVFSVLLVLLLLPFAYIYIQKSYYSPLNNILKVITDLEKGNYYKRRQFVEFYEFDLILEELRKLSSDIEKLNLDLNEKNMSLAHIKQNKDFEQKQEKDLIYSITHEIKQPLAVIEASTYAILDGIYQGDKANQQLNLIIKECQDSITMVQELLDIFKLNRSDYTLNKERIDLPEFISKKTEDFSQLFQKYNQELELNIDKDSYIIGDFNQISRVFSNIILAFSCM